MSTTKKISIGLYYLNAIIAIGFGSLYFFKSDLMPYHYTYMSEAGETIAQCKARIEAFDPRIIELMEALKWIVGTGLIGVGIGTFISSYYVLRLKDNVMANILTFAMLMIPNATLLKISYGVAKSITERGGEIKPPWMLSVVALVFIIIAFVLELIPDKKAQNT